MAPPRPSPRTDLYGDPLPPHALVKQAGVAGKVFQVGFQRRFNQRLLIAV
jgi:hypothetical protein